MPSDDIAISVRNLSKTYRLFNHPGDRIKQFLSLGMKQYHREFTALKDVSFDIKKRRNSRDHWPQRFGEKHVITTDLRHPKADSGTV